MITKYEVVFFDLGDTLVRDKKWLPGAKELLELLLKDKIRLGVISNTGNLSRTDVLSNLPSDFTWNFFENELILLSSETKVEKPAPAIFRLALKMCNSKPIKCLFCTENVVDGLVAQQVGLQFYRVLPPPNSDINNAYINLSKI